VCVYIYICIYICMHTHCILEGKLKRMNFYVYIYIYINTCIYICLHTYVHTENFGGQTESVYIHGILYTCVYMHTYKRMYTQKILKANRKRMYSYVCIYIYIYIYIYTYVCTHRMFWSANQVIGSQVRFIFI